MGKAQELATKITLKGKIDPSLQQAFKKADRLTDGSITKLKAYGETAKKVGAIVGSSIAGGLVFAAKQAIDYESAFAGVMKTVDETATTSYEDLSRSIRDMAKEIPASTTEIAAVAEAAGQLGVKADDISKFTKVMVNLGETTNLSSDVAATSIAKLFNITGTSMDKVDRFGATIVALGNNAATTEADIMEMAMRIAGSAKQINMTETQILALATSLSSVGMEAEAGGTAISTVMTQIDMEVATNGKTLSTWAKTAGLSVGEFKKMWSTDAYGAMQKVIAGMGDVKANGGNLNLVLDDLGITGIRTADSMKRLSSASEMMNDMTGLATKAWNENTALTEEAQKRYDTLASKIQLFKNKLLDAALIIGDKLTPHIDKMLNKLDEIDFEEVANRIGEGVDWIEEHFDQIMTAIKVLGGAFIAFKIGKFVKTLYDAGTAVTGALKACSKTKAISKLADWFGKLGNKAADTTKTVDKVPKGLDNAGASAGSNVGNILSMAVAFVALGAGVALAAGGLWTISQAAISLSESGWTAIGVMFGMVAALAALAYGASVIGAALTAGSWGFISFGAAMLMAAGAIWIISKSAGGLEVIFQSIVDTVVPILKQFGDTVNDILNGVGDLIESIGKAIESVINAVANVFESMGNAALNAGLGFEALARGVEMLTDINLLDMAGALIAVGGAVGTLVIACAGIDTVGQGMKNFATSLMMIVTYGNMAVVVMNTLPNQIQGSITRSISIYTTGMNKLPTITRTSLDLVVAVFRTNQVTILAVISKTVADSIKKVQSGKSGMFKAGASLAEGLVSGMRSKMNEVRRAAQELSNASNVTATLRINGNVEKTVSSAGKTAGKVKAYAKGGTVSQPHLAVVGDRPETIVPHGDTPRNRMLLSEATQKVTGGKQGGNTYQFTFAPQINGGDKDEIKKILEAERKKFKEMIDEYMNEKERLAF